MATNQEGDNKVTALQSQVQDVTNIMNENVNNVLEREGKLKDLEDRASVLKQGADQFEKSGIKLRKKMWWENMKMKIIIAVLALLLIIIIIYHRILSHPIWEE